MKKLALALALAATVGCTGPNHALKGWQDIIKPQEGNLVTRQAKFLLSLPVATLMHTIDFVLLNPILTLQKEIGDDE